MLINKTRESVKNQNVKETSQLKNILKIHLLELLKTIESPLKISQNKPFVIMVVGVNGTGKTTSIGKLTKIFQSEGQKVLIGAGDTFRAAAVAAVRILGAKRVGAQVIQRKKWGPQCCYF